MVVRNYNRFMVFVKISSAAASCLKINVTERRRLHYDEATEYESLSQAIEKSIHSIR